MSVIQPRIPFVWPEPRVQAGDFQYQRQPPYGDLVSTATALCAVVSGLTKQGISVLEQWIEENSDLKIMLVLAIYPTSQTTLEDGQILLGAMERYAGRLLVRAYPLEHVYDRTTNVLCFLMKQGKNPHLVTGASEDLGLATHPDAHMNFTYESEPVILESFRRCFDWIWAQAGDFSAEGVAEIPRLILPEGTEEGAILWREYQQACRDAALLQRACRPTAQVDPESGRVVFLSPEGEMVASPTEELGFPEFDPVADYIARLYNLGEQVTIDRHSRIPPLEAPIDPAIFGDLAQMQRGKIQRKVSMRVTVIDEATLKEINKYRTGLRTLLTRFTFGLADGDRWMPMAARALFEQECTLLEEAGRKFVANLVGDDVSQFLESRRSDLAKDLQNMAKELEREQLVTQAVISSVMSDMHRRLTRATSSRFLPTLTYKRVALSLTETPHGAPWGCALSLLLDITAFPRKAMTDPFFFRGIGVTKDVLIEAMDVAGDAIVRERRNWGIEDRCKQELGLIDHIKATDAEARDKCAWLIRMLEGQLLPDEVFGAEGTRE